MSSLNTNKRKAQYTLENLAHPSVEMHCEWKNIQQNFARVRGNYNMITGCGAHVSGNHNVVLGTNARVTGKWNTVIGDNGTIVGSYNKIWGENYTVRGNNNFYGGGTGTAERQPGLNRGNSFITQKPKIPPQAMKEATSILRGERAPVSEAPPVAKKQKFSLLNLEGNAEHTAEATEQCCVCLDNKKDVLFEPCLHLCVCVECARNLQGNEKKPKCPKCRSEIENAKRVFT